MKLFLTIIAVLLIASCAIIANEVEVSWDAVRNNYGY